MDAIFVRMFVPGMDFKKKQKNPLSNRGMRMLHPG
jgi:hypothetical protein